MIHLQRALAGLAVIGTLGFAGWFGTAIGHADPFDQGSFPCHEDEVLGFAPEFGPDRVGCIHVETLVVRELDRIESEGGEKW